MTTPDGRIPWEVVETFPTTSAPLISEWEHRVGSASDEPSRARAQIGLALVRYWEVQEGLATDAPRSLATRRRLVADAVATARRFGDRTLIAEVLLADLYSTWGPDSLLGRGPILAELAELRGSIGDEEVGYRIDEWLVLDAFDHGDLSGAVAQVGDFRRRSEGTHLKIFERRADLWTANIAMLTGEIDRAVEINRRAISGTSDMAGTPFSFQNVAITTAIERYFRRRLGDVVDAIQSIRASSPRVSSNWTVGLAFALSEAGRGDEARSLYEQIVRGDEAPDVPRDLNWLVTMQLVGLTAARVGDRADCQQVLSLLRPYAHLDATHGSGYASYGPVGRVVGMLAAALGRHDEALGHFDDVLATRTPGPWTSLTRMVRARALCEVDPRAAVDEARRAGGELAELGLDAWAGDARTLETRLAPLNGVGVASLGQTAWTLHHPVGTVTVPDGVGVRILTELLRRPGRALSAIRLGGVTSEPPTSAMHSLDPQAAYAYRRRLQELDQRGDHLTQDEHDERRHLVRELAQSRHAPSVSVEEEKARIRVTKALRRTIRMIETHSPELGLHLDQSITTGNRCSYDPPDGRAWLVRRSSASR